MPTKLARLVTKDLIHQEMTTGEKTKTLLESYLTNVAVYKESEVKVVDSNRHVRYRYGFKLPSNLSLILMNEPIYASGYQDIENLHYSLDMTEERFMYLITEDIYENTNPVLKMTVSMNLQAGETLLIKSGSLVISAIFLGYHTLANKNSYVFQVRDIYEPHNHLKDEEFYEYAIENPAVYDESELDAHFSIITNNTYNSWGDATGDINLDIPTVDVTDINAIQAILHNGLIRSNGQTPTEQGFSNSKGERDTRSSKDSKDDDIF